MPVWRQVKPDIRPGNLVDGKLVAEIQYRVPPSIMIGNHGIRRLQHELSERARAELLELDPEALTEKPEIRQPFARLVPV